MKKTVAKVLEKVLAGTRRFWAFHLCAVALAVLLVLANHDVVGDASAAKVSQGAFWGALAGLFAQFLYEWRRWPWRDLGVGAATLVVGALGCWFWLTIVEGTPRFRFWGMLYYGTCFSLAAASVAVLYRIADARSLVSRLTLNALVAGGSAMIVVSSLMLCLLAFDKLVVPVDGRLYGDVAGVSWIILLSVGFFSFLPDSSPDDGSSDRATAFLFWLLLPAALLLLGILYLYLGKIALSWSMPSGELNWFGSAALAVYTFFWLALRDSKRTFFRLFVRWGWALLPPVLVAQIVGIVIRYQAYGLSSVRFAGMVVLSFGLVALVLAALDRRPHGLFVFIALAGLVFMVTPLNIVDVPVYNQERRLEAALARNGLLKGGSLELVPGVRLSDEDAKTVSGAWRYPVPRAGGVRPTVLYGPSFTTGLLVRVEAACRARKIDPPSLVQLLGIDAGKASGGKSASGRLTSAAASVSGDGFLPLFGSMRIRFVNRLDVYRELKRGGWWVQMPAAGGRPKERFDVTAQVEHLFRGAGWDGVLTDATEPVIQPSDAVWELRPGMLLAFEAASFYGKTGEEVRGFRLSRCVLVLKPDEESPKAK